MVSLFQRRSEGVCWGVGVRVCGLGWGGDGGHHYDARQHRRPPTYTLFMLSVCDVRVKGVRVLFQRGWHLNIATDESNKSASRSAGRTYVDRFSGNDWSWPEANR